MYPTRWPLLLDSPVGTTLRCSAFLADKVLVVGALTLSLHNSVNLSCAFVKPSAGASSKHTSLTFQTYTQVHGQTYKLHVYTIS